MLIIIIITIIMMIIIIPITILNIIILTINSLVEFGISNDVTPTVFRQLLYYNCYIITTITIILTNFLLYKYGYIHTLISVCMY